MSTLRTARLEAMRRVMSTAAASSDSIQDFPALPRQPLLRDFGELDQLQPGSAHKIVDQLSLRAGPEPGHRQVLNLVAGVDDRNRAAAVVGEDRDTRCNVQRPRSSGPRDDRIENAGLARAVVERSIRDRPKKGVELP